MITDYIYYRSMGFGKRQSFKMAWQRWQFTITHMSVLVIAVCALAYLAYSYYAITINYEMTHRDFQIVRAKFEKKRAVIDLDKMERIVIGCLNGESVVIDGMDTPCKFGRYVNGREVY